MRRSGVTAPPSWGLNTGTTMRIEAWPMGSSTTSAAGRALPLGGMRDAANRSPESMSMCGIIGYVGSDEVVPVLLDGLRRARLRRAPAAPAFSSAAHPFPP